MRIFLSTITIFLLNSGLILSSCSNAQNQNSVAKQKGDISAKTQNVLIVYLTRTNNTKAVAEMIQSKVGGNLVALELVNPYPANYQQHVKQVDEENDRNYLPPLKTKIDSIQTYDVVFIGFPTWDMQVPPPVKTFLSENDWTGKTIIPFNTNAGYGLGSSKSQFEKYCSKGTLIEIFSVTGGHEREGIMYVMKDEKAIQVSKLLDNWLKKIGIVKN